jgi:hypothetical protein
MSQESAKPVAAVKLGEETVTLFLIQLCCDKENALKQRSHTRKTTNTRNTTKQERRGTHPPVRNVFLSRFSRHDFPSEVCDLT